MKSLLKSIHKWRKEHKVRRELKKDQALRERCIDYVVKAHRLANAHLADSIYRYIKNGSID